MHLLKDKKPENIGDLKYIISIAFPNIYYFTGHESLPNY